MRTALAIAMVAMLANAAQAQTASSAGPSSLQETYRDWSVVCIQQETQRRCVMSQQLSQQGGRRVLAFELSTDAGGETATGMLVLPFGLALDEGVTLTVDDAAPARVRFTTCLPAGCLAPLTLDSRALTQLRRGKALNLAVAASDTGDVVEFTISLDGFNDAFARLTGLNARP